MFICASEKVNNQAKAKKQMDNEKAVRKAIQKRVKSRRYSGKYKGRGKYKPKDPV